ECPGEAGSGGSNPLGREDGAISGHRTPSLTYVAPADRDRANAVARCELSKSDGSTRAVASGAVPGVEYLAATRPARGSRFEPATPADAVTAAKHTIVPPAAR